MTNQSTEAYVKQKDARLLREGLAAVFKTAPAPVKERIHGILLRYADAVKGYCQCTDRSFVAKERLFACLDCGRRYPSETGKSEIRLVTDDSKE